MSFLTQSIQALCAQINPLPATTNWRELSEENLLKEATLCIFGSQMKFEMAIAMIDKLQEARFFLSAIKTKKCNDSKITAIINQPITFSYNERLLQSRPRFSNRLAHCLSQTITSIYGSNLTFHNILSNSTSPNDARINLIKNVSGFGPKQSSLYLRRIGFSSKLAIIDTHIIHYIEKEKGIKLKSSFLSKLDYYQKIELEFKKISKEIGFPVGRVDLATWITMRVAKRESYV